MVMPASFTRTKLPTCVRLIQNDEIVTAFAEAKKTAEWNANFAGKCLIQLQLLLHKVSSQEKSLSSTPEDVFVLANYCCSTIKDHNYEFDLSKFITCIYFVVKYLLEKKLLICARKLCEYIVELKSEKQISLKNDEKILKSMCSLFSVALYNSDVKSLLSIEKNDDDNSGCAAVAVIRSIIDLWKLNCNLRKCCTEIMISDSIVILGYLSSKFDSLNENIVKYIYEDGLKYLLNSLKNNNKMKNILLPDLNVAFINLIKLLSISVSSLLKFNNFSEFTVILNSLKDLIDLFHSENQKKFFTFFEKFLYFLYLFVVPPSDRDMDCSNIHPDIILKELCVSFKELSAINDNVSEETNLLVICSLEKIKSPLKYDSHGEVNLPEKTFDSLFEFLFTLSDYCFSKFGDFKCCDPLSDKNCSIKNETGHTFNVLFSIIHLFNSLSKYNTKCLPDCYFHHAKRLQRELLHLLDLLIKAQCHLFEEYSPFVFNCCMKVNNFYMNLELYNQCAFLAKQLCVYIISLRTEDFNKMSKKCVLLNVLISYYYCCHKVNESLKGLIAITAWSLADSGNRYNDKLIEFWITVKISRHCPSDIMGLTICDVARDCAELLVDEWGLKSTLVENADFSSFLLLEIRAYRLKRSLQGEPLNNAFEALMSLKPIPNAVILAEALIFVIDLATKSPVYTMNESVKLVFESVSEKLINKKNKTLLELCELGNLLHCKVRCDIYSKRNKFENTLLKCTVKELPLQVDRETGLVVDANDSFDTNVVESATLFLNQEPFMQQLDSGLKYLKDALTLQNKQTQEVTKKDNNLVKNSEDILPSDLELLSLKNINCTAQLYALHNDNKRAVKTWHQLYDLCPIKYSDIALNAISQLLSLTTSITGRDELLKKVTTLGYKSISTYQPRKFLDLSSSTNEEKLFFIQLARQYLLSPVNLVDCSYILNAIAEFSPFNNNLLYAHYLRTVCEYLALPNSRSLWTGQPLNIFVALSEANNCLRYIVQNSIWHDYNEHIQMNRLLLEISLVASNCFQFMGFPHEAYFSLKGELIVAQKLALSTWTCRLLTSLAWIDISVLKIEDCELKISNLEGILGLKTNREELRRTNQKRGTNSVYTSNEGSPVLGKSISDVLYDEDCVLGVLEKRCTACLFFDVIILKATVYLIKDQSILTKKIITYGFQKINRLKHNYDYESIFESLSVRRVVLLFLQATLEEESKNYQTILKNYEEVSKYYGGVSPVFVPFVKNCLIFQSFIKKYKIQKSCTDQTNQDVLCKKFASLPLGSPGNIPKTPPKRTPPVINKLIDCKTPTSNSINTCSSALSPGDVPIFKLPPRKLFSFTSEHSDDEIDSKPLNLRCITRSTKVKNKIINNESPSKFSNAVASGSTCRPFKLFSDNDSDENENKIDKLSKIPVILDKKKCNALSSNVSKLPQSISNKSATKRVPKRKQKN